MVRHETTAQTPGTWTATGSMSIGRSGFFTATLLTNGKVLVAGGYGSAGAALSSVELYDSNSGAWTPTTSMSIPRALHTATLLPDGKVLVAGGQNDTGATSSAELYDPGTGLWTLTGSMNVPRSAHMATLITGGPLSGMLIVAAGSSEGGGGSNNLVSAELYDPSTGLWTYTGSMAVARYFDDPSPTALPDGSILIMGGTTCCPYHWLNEADLYDSVSQTWTPTSSKTTPANGRSVLLPDGKVLVAGGVQGTQPTAQNVAAAELFDPTTGTWTATASMSTDRALPTLTLLASGQALVAGGASGGWGVCNDLTSAELYDSSTGTWFLTGSLTVPRIQHTATILPNGQVLAAGGHDCEGNILSSAELYTPPPVAALSTTSLTFGVQLVGTRSAAQTATLTNAGTTTLTISSIAASGDFLQKNNCGSSLPAGESCTIRIAFTPTDKGTRTGNVMITDTAANSPQVIALTGTGTVVQLTPTSVNFGEQRVGTVSHPQSVTLTNTGSTPLSIRGIGIVGRNFSDFIETTTCGSSVPANSSCEIDVRFAPSDAGTRTASMKVQHDGGGEQPVKLRGTGVSN
jgi:hypothetical protein